MALILDRTIHFLVEEDGQPREAEYDDGVRRMLFLEDGKVQSCALEEWEARQKILAKKEREREDGRVLRQRIRDQAESAVGRRADQLTLPEMRALFALLVLCPTLDKDGAVRPLSEWLGEG